MLVDLHSVLRLDEKPLNGQCVLICEEEDQLGAFLLHHFLHLGTRLENKVILFGIESSFGHFNGVG